MNQKALKKFIVGFLAFYPVFAPVLVGILFAVVEYTLVSAIGKKNLTPVIYVAIIAYAAIGIGFWYLSFKFFELMGFSGPITPNWVYRAGLPLLVILWPFSLLWGFILGWFFYCLYSNKDP